MDAGITVQYLFFPRSGPNTESYFKAVSVWCADDRNEALTDAKLNDKVVNKTCANPVDEHMKLAQAFGVTGTPAIITEDGTLVPGFVPAKDLVKHLGW
jgi:thiol:disulfide interchange protein DsbC